MVWCWPWPSPPVTRMSAKFLCGTLTATTPTLTINVRNWPLFNSPTRSNPCLWLKTLNLWWFSIKTRHLQPSVWVNGLTHKESLARALLSSSLSYLVSVYLVPMLVPSTRWKCLPKRLPAGQVLSSALFPRLMAHPLSRPRLTLSKS